MITIDDSITNVVKSPIKTDQLDFDQQSNEIYKSWISRIPQTFAVYNDKREPIAKLPLHLFWYNKVQITHATKCTSKFSQKLYSIQIFEFFVNLVTAPLEVRAPTPKPVPIPQPTPTPVVEVHEKVVPPVVIPPKPVVIDESTEPALSRLAVTEEQVEMIITTYEDKISKMQESYQ